MCVLFGLSCELGGQEVCPVFRHHVDRFEIEQFHLFPDVGDGVMFVWE